MCRPLLIACWALVSAWRPSTAGSLGTAPRHAAAAPALHAYVHIPFCRRRCFYCDFTVQVVGDRPGSVDPVAEGYVDVLCREIAATARLDDCGRLAKQAGGLRTVYLGGGTPSLLPPALLRRVMDALRCHFGIAPDAEATVEMDPGTFDQAKLEAYIQAGMNRVSLGVQSLDDDLLQGAGRAHTAAEAVAAAGLLASNDLNWSLDLISGLPNATGPLWEATLDAALALGPRHLSVYDLQVESGTAFGRWFDDSTRDDPANPLPDTDEAAQFYRTASHKLRRAGYEHYEVSSYARPGARSKHNSCYWDMRSYHGLGQGASSFLGGKRFTRPTTPTAYEAWVANLEASVTPGLGTMSAVFDEDPSSSVGDHLREDVMLEEIMVRLRTSDGLDLTQLDRSYERLRGNADAQGSATPCSTRVRKAVADALDAGLVTIDGPVLRLTDPDGFLLSNAVIGAIFAEFD